MIKIKKKLGIFKELLLDGVCYIKNKLVGGNYADFYGKRMDRRISKNKNWGLNLNKAYQVEFLKANGLKPSHTFLDFGCGAISAGIYFIEYLNEGNYTGVDVSKEVVKEAKFRLENSNFFNKNARIMHLPKGELRQLKVETFDIIWAQSVLTHMPIDEIHKLFRDVKNFMNKNSFFYFTFVPPSNGKEESIRDRLKDWFHPTSILQKIAEDEGYDFFLVKTWSHPENPGVDRLAKISIR